MPKTLICIVCPAGCRLTVRRAGADWAVAGNQCARGRDYAIGEQTDPRRTVTAVVRTDAPHLPWAPVKTTRPVRKDAVFRLLRAIYAREIHAPFEAGAVVISNFEDDGVDVVLTREDGAALNITEKI